MVGGVEAHGLERRPAGALQVPQAQEDGTQRAVGLGGAGIQGDGRLGGGLPLAQQGLALREAPLAEGPGGAQLRQGPGVLGADRGVVRLDLDGGLQERVGQLDGVLVAFREDLLGLGVELPGAGIPRLDPGGSAAVAAQAHLLGEPLLELVLDLQEVSHGPVQLELVRGGPVQGVHHPDAHADLPAHHLVAAQHQHLGLELAPQLAQGLRGLAGRVAQLVHGLHHPEAVHHQHVLPPDEPVGHGVREAVAQPGVGRIGLQLLQGQDGHHAPALGEVHPGGPSRLAQPRGQRPTNQQGSRASAQDQHAHGRRHEPPPPGAPDPHRRQAEVGDGSRGVVLGQPRRQGLQAGKAVLGGLGHQAVDGVLEGAGQVGPQLRQRPGLIPRHSVERVHEAGPAEGVGGRGQFVEHHAQAELVGLPRERLAVGLLGTHVGGGALAVARRRALHQGHVVGGLPHGEVLDAAAGDAEVQDLELTVLREEHVLGLDVAVDDALLVRMEEGRSRLARQVLEGGSVQRPAHQGAQGLAFHQLHGDVGGAVHFPGVVDVGDVRMVELAGQLGLADERLAAQVVGILEDLERHFPFEAQVQGPPDLAHGSFAQPGEQTVGAEVGCVEGQACPCEGR